MKIKRLLPLLVLPLLVVSCTSYKNVPYLQNPEVMNDPEGILLLYDAKIMPKDLPGVTVNTTDLKAATPLNLTVQTPTNAALTNISATTQSTMQQYLVDNKGEIDFPVIDRLEVGGLTKNETKNLIHKRLKPYLKEPPIIMVRMSSYKISMSGEVARPGSFTIGNEEVSVLEALAMVGGITVYGVRDNVKLIREDVDGKREIINLNLNNAEIVASPHYYLEQNDIVYVTPNKMKAKNSDIGNSATLWVSSLSALVSIAGLLINILKWLKIEN